MIRSALGKVMWVEKARTLALCLLALLVAASIGVLAATKPGHAAPSTFIVNSTADTGDATPDGACSATCTLMEAIQEANANNNPNDQDQINFNISGAGVHTISLSSALPFISEPVIINGYSQPGSSANTLAQGTNAILLIRISPATPETFIQTGLEIRASNSVVKGLVISDFIHGTAISIFPGSQDNHLTNVRIEGNFVGTNPAGTEARRNGRGVGLSFASNNIIGGDSPATRNLISGNTHEGVVIEGNQPLGLQLGRADNNMVQGNLIGTQKDGITALGNTGVGVAVLFAAIGNSILSNSIFSNNGLGIDLNYDGRTANDPGDTDTKSNLSQNFPVLTSAKTSRRATTIAGTLNSTPNTPFRVQFFSNPSGTDEGKTFIGEKNVSTDASGNAAFTFKPAGKVARGQNITATATDPADNTSEFSAPKKVVRKR